MIIGLTGNAGVGKSTAADFFENHGFVRDAYASTMKKAVSEMFSIQIEILHGDIEAKSKIDPYWQMTYRQILQIFGTEACRHAFGGDIWERVLWRRHDICLQQDPFYNLVIEDVRFDNEAEAVRNRGGIVVLILRSGYTGDSHASEHGIDPELVSDVIINNGTKFNLYDKLGRFLA